MKKTRNVIRWGIIFSVFLSVLIVIITIAKYGYFGYIASPEMFGAGASSFEKEMFFHFYNMLIDMDLAFLLHSIFGSIALLTGALQMLRSLKNKTGRLHINTGLVYALSVTISSSGGFFMAQNSLGGPVASAGFALASIIWFFTLGIAIIHTIRKNYDRHALWFKINFALTFAAVTLRLEMPLINGLGFDLETSYQIASWLCWIPNVIIASLLSTGSNSISGRPLIQPE